MWNQFILQTDVIELSGRATFSFWLTKIYIVIYYTKLIEFTMVNCGLQNLQMQILVIKKNFEKSRKNLKHFWKVPYAKTIFCHFLRLKTFVNFFFSKYKVTPTVKNWKVGRWTFQNFSFVIFFFWYFFGRFSSGISPNNKKLRLVKHFFHDNIFLIRNSATEFLNVLTPYYWNI